MEAKRDERIATDRGLTGDKIKVIDPAAAPLETDAETSGIPTSPTAARASLARILDIALTTPRPETFGAWRQPDAAHQRELGWKLAFWTVAMVLLGVVAAWIGFL